MVEIVAAPVPERIRIISVKFHKPTRSFVGSMCGHRDHEGDVEMKELKVEDVPERIVKREVAVSRRSNLNERSLRGQRLKATWEGACEPCVDGPSSVSWEDGRPATLEDFHTHELDTHFWSEDDDGHMCKFMYPDIIADVVFDRHVMDWVVQGSGVVTTALDLKDPNTPDGDIVAALFTLETVYKSRIIR
jgi:hypothetical protein